MSIIHHKKTQNHSSSRTRIVNETISIRRIPIPRINQIQNEIKEKQQNVQQIVQTMNIALREQSQQELHGTFGRQCINFAPIEINENLLSEIFEMEKNKILALQKNEFILYVLPNTIQNEYVEVEKYFDPDILSIPDGSFYRKMLMKMLVIDLEPPELKIVLERWTKEFESKNVYRTNVPWAIQCLIGKFLDCSSIIECRVRNFYTNNQ